MGNNINVPYSSYINGGVRDGMELFISGTPGPNADRFSINFCSGQTIEQGDCAFHFNPRFSQGCVVRNHKHGSMWGGEETAGGMPFRRGQRFTLQLQVGQQGFKVLINNRHFCDFTSRLSLATIQYLYIVGDIFIQDIYLSEDCHTPSSVPCTTFIGGGVSDGLKMVINGTPRPNCKMFSINLITGPTCEAGDVVFHFNPRFNQGSVVRNNRQTGQWRAEETAGGMPFRRGHPFNVTLIVNNNGYKVLVNGNHFCDFTHRVAKETVQNLNIKGDVTIQSIKFVRPNAPVSCPPAPAPAYASASMSYPVASGPIYNPAVPVIMPIQGGFYPGKIIHITGVPHSGGSRFHFNLATGFAESSDLALHFDVRFSFGSDHNVVIRTHRQGGQYGREERDQPYFPFMQNANFEIMLLCEPQSMKVAVNNQHFIEFNHRLHANLVNHLQIKGDVTIHQVRFQ